MTVAEALPRSRSFDALRKYWTVFQVCLAERLAYRIDFIITTLLRFLPILTITFLWTAIFAGSDSSRIAGFTRDEIVAYNLLVFISRAFSSMPGLSIGIAADIREGNIKKYLTQPIDMLGFLFTMRVAHKLVYYLTALLPYAIVLYLCRHFFSGWPSTTVFVAFLLSLVGAFLIGFLFESLIGLLGFWILEVTSITYITMSILFVLSGHMFPLDLLPPNVAEVIKWMPFQYMAYFPAKLFLHGDLWTNGELGFEMSRMLGSIVVLAVIVMAVYRSGLRRYSAFGG